MNENEKALVLNEALPYIKKFFGRVLVIKVGGSIMDESPLLKKLMQDIVLLKYIGMKPVVVHGGGKHISSLLARLGKKSEFIHGLRVTDKETMDVTQMVLAGLINKDLVSMISQAGGKAVGLSGKDGDLILAKKLKKKDIDYGHVGEIIKINPRIVELLESDFFIPVISPIGSDSEGNSLNINADEAAEEIAVSLGAEKLVFLTDINGVLKDVKDESTLMQKIKIAGIPALKKNKIISAGMIPKLESSSNAIRRGVGSVHIISGKKPHSLLLELFTDSGVGTQILK